MEGGVLSRQQHLQPEGTQVVQQEVGRMRRKLFGAREASGHRHAADSIDLRRSYIVGMVAHVPDSRVATEPTALAGLAERGADKIGAVGCKLRECTKTEVMFEAGALHLFPADPREVAGHKARWHTTALEAPQQPAHARADFRV